MVKANSLLYAVYICLIVSVICAALLFFSGLYTQLNLYYNLKEDLYIYNQSAVNYALHHLEEQSGSVADENGIESEFKLKPFGVLNILQVKSFSQNDTVSSLHIVGQTSQRSTCLYLANFSQALSYYGDVVLIGDRETPTGRIEESFVGATRNKLKTSGKDLVSSDQLPELSEVYKNAPSRGNFSNTSIVDFTSGD